MDLGKLFELKYIGKTACLFLNMRSETFEPFSIDGVFYPILTPLVILDLYNEQPIELVWHLYSITSKSFTCFRSLWPIQIYLHTLLVQ